LRFEKTRSPVFQVQFLKVMTYVIFPWKSEGKPVKNTFQPGFNPSKWHKGQ
jgi:hypothetical protein